MPLTSDYIRSEIVEQRYQISIHADDERLADALTIADMETAMEYHYGDCFFCGGSIEERLVPREMHWHGELLIFENVPTGVCTQCGEKFLRPDVAKKIDAALQSMQQPSRVVSVPVYQY